MAFEAPRNTLTIFRLIEKTQKRVFPGERHANVSMARARQWRTRRPWPSLGQVPETGSIATGAFSKGRWGFGKPMAPASHDSSYARSARREVRIREPFPKSTLAGEPSPKKGKRALLGDLVGVPLMTFKNSRSTCSSFLARDTRRNTLGEPPILTHAYVSQSDQLFQGQTTKCKALTGLKVAQLGSMDRLCGFHWH